MICRDEGCKNERQIGGYCKPCYKRLWRLGQVGHSLLTYDALKPALRRAARTLGSYSALDKMCGLSNGQTRALLKRNRYIHVKTADQICTKLGLPFNELFKQELA